MSIQTESINTLKRIISDDDLVPPPAKKAKRSTKKPSQLVRDMFEQSGTCTEHIVVQAQHKLIEPSQEMIAAYTMEITKAVRNNDIEKVRELHASGALLDCCNKFGDTLLNIACRRSYTQLVKYLLEEAKVTVYMKDDTGRNALHDACWASAPNFIIVKLLLDMAPELAVLRDNRGFTPFDYTRSADCGKWCDFLEQHESIFSRLKNNII